MRYLLAAASNKLVPVIATFQAYQGTNANKIMSGVKTFFGNLGTYGGGLYTVGAIFMIAMASRNEDAEGRNKGFHHLIGAIALLSIGAIIKLFFND